MATTRVAPVTDEPVSDEPVFVEVLTDEELSVVARPGPMPVMPFLDDLPEQAAEVARRSAYRSLIARGIVDPPTPEAVAEATARRDGSVELMVRQDVRSAVALREAAQVVVALARTTVVTQDYWYAHLVDDVVLLEEVSRDGMHRFALARAAQLSDLAASAAVHPDAGDADGEPVTLVAEEGDPTPPDEVLERLGAAFVRTDVIVRRPGDTEPPRFAVFSGPDGTWVVEGVAAVAHPMSAEAARSRVLEAVDGVRAEGVALHG